MSNSGQKFDVVIVGAGFAGLYLLHKVRGLGLTARVIDAGGDVGGTWYWNRYPGARCDVESFEYCYTFDNEIAQEWVWTERYAAQPEILAYINHVADHLDLRKDIEFGTRVEGARFVESSNRWVVDTDSGQGYDSRFFIVATGCLSVPLYPRFEGQDAFKGEIYHTGDWPTDPVDFSDKKVAVIGTGSSGVQVAPVIAKEAGSLDVYQRTPAFTAPIRNRPLSAEEMQDIKDRYEEIWSGMHPFFGNYGNYPKNFTPMAEQTPDEIEATLEEGWAIGGLRYLLSYPEVMLDSATNQKMADFMWEKNSARINDPELAKKLKPSGTLGAKRMVSEDHYYEMFNQDNVSLVDCLETPIERLTEKGIQTSATEHEYDVIVFATGFDAMTGAIRKMDIVGRDGQSLKKYWSNGVRTYLGMQSAGFPNMFLVAGTGTPSVFSNVVRSIETHVDFIANCLEFMIKEQKASIETSAQLDESWTEHVTETARKSLISEEDNWYSGANVAGKKRQFLPYMGGVTPFRQTCDEIAAADYKGFIFASVN